MFDISIEGEAELLRAQRQFAQGVWRASRTAVNAACEAGVAEAKRGRFKNNTGALRRTIHFVILREAADGVEGEMRAPQDYASYVEEGTKAHDIWPKLGEEGPLRQGQSRRTRKDIAPRIGVALRWKGRDGRIHFAPMVHHPGGRPYPFMGPAYVTAERVLTARMEAEIAAVTERLAA